MKYQLEINTLLTPVNAHLLFEKCQADSCRFYKI